MLSIHVNRIKNKIILSIKEPSETGYKIRWFAMCIIGINYGSDTCFYLNWLITLKVIRKTILLSTIKHIFYIYQI